MTASRDAVRMRRFCRVSCSIGNIVSGPKNASSLFCFSSVPQSCPPKLQIKASDPIQREEASQFPKHFHWCDFICCSQQLCMESRVEICAHLIDGEMKS